jgi:cytoskeletal protein CcmA (bactofilin family)
MFFDYVEQNSNVDLVSHKTTLKGNFTFGNTVKIDGNIEGKINTTNDGTNSLLLIGQDAHISAEIECDSIIIEGLVHGNIIANGNIEIRQTGILFGKIKASNIIIHPGGVFEGVCSIIRSN